jgi:ABC-type uncharacterized transport system ATPase subunit
MIAGCLPCEVSVCRYMRGKPGDRWGCREWPARTVETITGLRPLHSGQVRIGGEDAMHWSAHDFIRHNAAYISDDRQGDGLILSFDLSRNATLKTFDRIPFSRAVFLNFRVIVRFTRGLIANFDVRAPGPHLAAGKLSGGNQQKLILGA